MCVNEKGNVWRIGPFSIEKKTNFLSASVFIISIIALGLSVLKFAKGPNLQLLTPSTIVIYSQPCFTRSPGYPHLRIIVPISILNDGIGEAPSAVKRINLTLSSSLGVAKFYADDIGEYESSAPHGMYLCPIDLKESGKFDLNSLNINIVSDFNSFAVKYGEVKTNNVLFSPIYNQNIKFGNYIKTKKLLSMLSDNKNFKLNFEFEIVPSSDGFLDKWFNFVFGGNKLNCEIEFDQLMREIFLERSWVTPQPECQ